MSDSGREELQVPCLGRSLDLGILYDCRNDSFIPDQRLWSHDSIQTNAKQDKREARDYAINTEDSFTKKAACFKLEPSTKLNFLANLISVKGSANYLSDKKSSSRQVRVVLWYHWDTFIEKIQVVDQLILDDNIVQEVNDKGSATHVITAVQYGFDAFFVFDGELTSSDDHKNVQVFLRNALIQTIKSHNEGHKSVLIKSKDREKLNKFRCTYHGDLPLLNPPTTFDEAMDACRDLPALIRQAAASDKDVYGVPKVAYLHPLKEFISDAPEYVSISSKLADEILALLEDLFGLQGTARNLLEGKISCLFPGIQQQINKFEDLLGLFIREIQKSLGTILPQVRGNESEESVLTEYVRSLQNSCFDVVKLKAWIEAKREEALILEPFLVSTGENCLFVAQDKELEQLIRDESIKYVLALSFGTIAANSHPFLCDLEECLNDLGNSNEWDENYEEHWFNSDSIVTGFQRQLDNFVQFSSENSLNKELKCVMMGSAGRRNSSCNPGETFLYTGGSRRSFQPPSPPGPPTMVNNMEYELEIKWEASQNGSKGILDYSIAYQRTDEVDKCHWGFVSTGSRELQCRITQLEPKTAYVLKVAAVCEAGKSAFGSPSPSFSTKALPSLAESMLADGCLKLLSTGTPSWYMVPLKETYHNPRMRLRKYEVGVAQTERPTTKVILVVGATGSGKTTLINGMINYLYGIKMEDNFRLKLIKEDLIESQAHSQTQYITAYTIYWQSGSKIDYNLTIVDTPGYGDTRGIAQDDHVTWQIREFFEMKGTAAIDHIDAVGFVAQASAVRLTDTQKYVFDAILSIFGRNISSNIFMLLTFADGRLPPALDAIKAHKLPYKQYFKFNNSVFTQASSKTQCITPDPETADLSVNETFDALFWQLAEESFNKFFQEFSLVEAQSLKLTKEVLAERQHLEITIENFHGRIRSGLNCLNQVRTELLVVEQYEAEKTANKQFTRVVQVPKTRRTHFEEAGRFVTNCLHCNVTCHALCRIANDDEKYKCAAMEKPGDPETTCTQCKDHCEWKKHVNRDYFFEDYLEYETITLEDLKKKYDYADKTLSEKDNILSGMYASYCNVQMLVIQDIETVRKCLQRLDQIAMKRNPMTTVDYIDVLIRSTKSEGKPGWQDRLSQLEHARERAEMIRKMENEGKEYDPFQEFKSEIDRVRNMTAVSKLSVTKKIKKFFGFRQKR